MHSAGMIHNSGRTEAAGPKRRSLTRGGCRLDLRFPCPAEHAFSVRTHFCTSLTSKGIQKRQSFDMTHFDDIYEIAADGYGIMTATQAREAGVTTCEMSRWCTDGRFIRRGHGVYKLARWVPTPLNALAEAAKLARTKDLSPPANTRT